jgi:hypothetical protein
MQIAWSGESAAHGSSSVKRKEILNYIKGLMARQAGFLAIQIIFNITRYSGAGKIIIFGRGLQENVFPPSELLPPYEKKIPDI